MFLRADPERGLPLGSFTVAGAATGFDQLAQGKITTDKGTKIDCGKAGTYEVGEAGEVLYNKPLMFTADNIDQYSF